MSVLIANRAGTKGAFGTTANPIVLPRGAGARCEPILLWRMERQPALDIGTGVATLDG